MNKQYLGKKRSWEIIQKTLFVAIGFKLLEVEFLYIISFHKTFYPLEWLVRIRI
jgi:hypothetical protein